MGANNFVDSFTVQGGPPQDYKFDPESATYVKIGDNNIFREYVTINRATGAGNSTVIGNGTYWMTSAHAGHNAQVADEVIMANGAALGGWACVDRKANLSAHVLVHQFCWIGEMVIIQGNGGLSCHMPPYVMAANINNVVGLNKVGLHRAPWISDTDRAQIKEAFQITYRPGVGPAKALAEMDAHTEWGAPAGVFREFLRRVVHAQPPYKRPLCRMRLRA
jgi:UDP-N-acetylglucosamine acyltransferase